ncbi:efflux RND transporter periplasmic adaptor subunit [Insolitispirillum peregrinum]|uniref:Membrane fusion protein, multidrug efflux system n=1 Tax=Insolitispirillum peregrinum TaxID=80876 RepID=A0A1N7MQ76_9PROT|nr:efflux RND transporter periplasmic adaptor subunit [Insolitispirillum peregrinum]SIS88293.1 membrane fusion protein, multidrug efflux system [Insolitispirillum peregrinum]
MPLPSKAVFLPFVLSLALAVAACDNQQQQGAAPAAPPPPEVTVQTLATQTVPLYTDLPGRTAAYRVAEVRPQVSGIVLKRLFTEGSEVQAGQQLYQIDPSTYQAAVQSAMADLAKARATAKSVEAKAARYADLVKINAVSKQDYDDAVASLDQAKADIMVAQAAVDTAKINLEYTKVYAPISGRIGKSAITEGALVTANQTTPMSTLTQLDPIYVDVSQSSSDLMRLRQAVSAGLLQKGQADQAPVTLTLDGSTQAYKHNGQLQFADVTVDETTGAVQVRAVFPNPDKELYPGLFVRARVEQGVRENALLVPQRATVRLPDGSAAVWVVGADNKVATRPIQATQAVGDAWLVNSGLQAGERIVIEGLQKIRAGAEVRPVDPTAAAAPAGQAAPAAAGQK